MKKLSLLLLLACMPAADFQNRDVSAVEAPPLDGSWDLVSAKDPAEATFPPQTWIFAGNQFFCRSGRGISGGVTVKTGFQNNLQTFDLCDAKDGTNLVCGIYKVANEQLTICCVYGSKDRPTRFADKWILLTFKRARP